MEYVQDARGNVRLICVAVTVHISQTRDVDFYHLPNEIKHTAIRVFETLEKMEDGRILRDGNRIDAKEIAEWASIMCNGEDVPDDGLEEVEDPSIAFPNLRM